MVVHAEYRYVEKALMRFLNLDEASAKTFRARLRHLKNLGVPEGIDVGSGRRAKYGSDQIFQIVLALELMATSLNPSLACNVALASWEKFRLWFQIANGNDDNQVGPWYLVYTPALPAGLDPDFKDGAIIELVFAPQSTLIELVQNAPPNTRYIVSINLTKSAKALDDALVYVGFPPLSEWG